MRYAAIGNAVSVPVIEWIAGRIKAVLKGASEERENPVEGFGSFANSPWVELPDIEAEHEKLVWPKSGLMWDGRFLGAAHRESPCKPKSATLYQIVEKHEVKQRYYLTPNAAEGILRRVDSNQRQLFAPLREGLEVLSGRKARS